MYYRIVMQGRTLGGADIEEVKQHFVRITGLSPRVAEQMFGGVPQVIKRQVPQSDAERIAATLRAIGAAATVERETPGLEDEEQDGEQILAAPLNSGPPTVIPGMGPPQEAESPRPKNTRWRRMLRTRWPLYAVMGSLVAGLVLLTPLGDGLMASQHVAPDLARPVSSRAAQPEVVPHEPPLNTSLLNGPWRCTDQTTGVSAYWSYAANGALTFHGDVLSDAPPKRAVATSAPSEWVLEGRSLQHRYAQRAADSFTVAGLTLARLRYRNERGMEVECRRP